MKLIRRPHRGYANVVATVALVFAISGGAYAASRYTINSTAQINPKVLKKLSGRVGSSGKTGAPGEEGRVGKAGATGATGPTGAPGQAGPQGAPGSPGSAAGFAYVNASGTVESRGGAVEISIDQVKTGEYCLLLTPAQESRAPIVATLQGNDATAGLISVNSSTGGDCNEDGGIGVFTKTTTGVPTDHDFVVALLQSRPGLPPA